MAVVHSHDPAFHVVCGIGGCVRSYNNYYSFKKHVYRKHRDYLDNSITSVITENVSEHDDDDDDVSESQNDGFDFAEFLDCHDYEQSGLQHKKEMALFLLKAKEVRKVSQSALDGLLSDFSTIVESITRVLKSSVSDCLSSKGLDISSFDGLEEAFSDLKITDPFHQLHSKFQQEKFYREHLNLVVRIIYIYIYIFIPPKLIIFYKFICTYKSVCTL